MAGKFYVEISVTNAHLCNVETKTDEDRSDVNVKVAVETVIFNNCFGCCVSRHKHVLCCEETVVDDCNEGREYSNQEEVEGMAEIEDSVNAWSQDDLEEESVVGCDAKERYTSNHQDREKTHWNNF